MITEENILEIITVSNGDSDYPGNFTPEEIGIIKSYCYGYILHLFSGRSTIGDVRIDYAMKEATINCDVFKFLKKCKEKFDTVIIDPPYNKRFAEQYQCIGKTAEQFIISAQSEKTTELFNFIKKLNPKIIIMKSWTYYIPTGYRLRKGYLCYAGGYRKPTILLILEKNTSKIYFIKEILHNQQIKKLSNY
jgi:hypothetical protein